MKTSERPEVQLFARHVSPRLISRLGLLGRGRLFLRAQGCRIEDHRGNSYLDASSGSGTAALGHHEEQLRHRLERALEEEPWGEEEGPRAEELKEHLRERSGFDGVGLTSSGAEAIDLAIKLAIAATHRTTLLSCKGSFHGLNLGALSLSSDTHIRQNFAPLLCHMDIPYGNIKALEIILAREKIAAFVLDPAQADGGVHIATTSYLAACKDLCARHGTLLILDEIRSGLGRCGYDFLWQKTGVKPDIVVLGKALGGSYCALAATLTSATILEQATRRASYLVSGYPVAGVNIASAVAIEFLEQLTPNLLHTVRIRGDELRTKLQHSIGKHPLIRDIRGCGLMLGIELGLGLGRWNFPKPPRISPLPLNQWISLRLLEEGVLCQSTKNCPEVLRLEPPLTLSSADASTIQTRILRVLREHEGATTVLASLLRRLGRQARAGWQF